MAAGPVSPQRVLVRHAGGILKLPLLPHDSVKSLRLQMQLLGLRPCELSGLGDCVQLRDDHTMEQAGVLRSRFGVIMATVVLPTATSAAAASSAAASPAASAVVLCLMGPRDPTLMKIYVSTQCHCNQCSDFD